MKQRLSALMLLVALACAILVAPFSASAASATTPSAAPAQQLAAIPITGSGPNASFVGTFDITRFATQNGQLVAIGTLTGTLTNTLTGVTQNVSQQVVLPVAQATGSCTILDLTLGPLHLNLLGLVVDLNQVHLTITAQQGSGNLLGNLLCAVANLLNGGSPLTSLTNLLNRILRLL